jgi:hypothetical protein
MLRRTQQLRQDIHTMARKRTLPVRTGAPAAPTEVTLPATDGATLPAVGGGDGSAERPSEPNEASRDERLRGMFPISSGSAGTRRTGDTRSRIEAASPRPVGVAEVKNVEVLPEERCVCNEAEGDGGAVIWALDRAAAAPLLHAVPRIL